MEKERKILMVQIAELKKQVEDVKDQNVQLQYKVEFTSEPMLMEKVQDITDMRCDIFLCTLFVEERKEKVSKTCIVDVVV